jgi:LuxR family transcriptional regulator, maltose regulon positive regulatory protein
VHRVSDAQERQRLTLELAGLETIFLSVYEDRVDAALVSGYAFLEASDEDDSFVARAVRNATAYCEINRGNMHLVHDLVRPAQLSALRNEQLFPTAYRYCIIGLSFRMQGALAEAERTFLSGLALAEGRGGRQSASSGLLAAFAARSLYEKGDLSGAAALLRDRLPVIDEAAFHEAVIDAYTVLIRIAGVQGKTEDAAALIERAELIGHERNWRRLLAVCVLERVRLGLSLTTDTQRLAPHNMCLALTTDLLSLEMRTYAIVAEALALSAILTDDFPEADRHREWLFRYACAAKNDPLLLRVALLKIVKDASQNPAFEIDAADASMLGRAMVKGYRRTILDGLAPVGDQRIRGLLASDDCLRELLVGLVGDEGGATPVDIGRSGTVFSILTSREIDVLTGVSRGDSNKEIARRLHLTPETVKWHLKNVMRKLHAESRAEAVDNAAALGLSLIGV